MVNPLKIVSFNIRTSMAQDGANHWMARRDLVVGSIRSNDPDLLAIQEPTELQWSYLTTTLQPSWDGVAHDRQDKIEKESHLQGLFFRRDRFRKIADGVFWLSDTPDVPGSITYPQDWGARTAVWVRLEDLQAKRELIYCCIHLDTREESWIPGARAASAYLRKLANGAPTILCGDFNCAAGCDAWTMMTGPEGFTDAWTATGQPDLAVTTFNAFRPIPKLPLNDMPFLEKWLHDTCDDVPQFKHYPAHVLKYRNYRIDWILYRGGFRTSAAGVDVRAPGGRTPSDHWPITATLNWMD